MNCLLVFEFLYLLTLVVVCVRIKTSTKGQNTGRGGRN
jgi:hypothetical protein